MIKQMDGDSGALFVLTDTLTRNLAYDYGSEQEAARVLAEWQNFGVFPYMDIVSETVDRVGSVVPGSLLFAGVYEMEYRQFLQGLVVGEHYRSSDDTYLGLVWFNDVSFQQDGSKIVGQFVQVTYEFGYTTSYRPALFAAFAPVFLGVVGLASLVASVSCPVPASHILKRRNHVKK